MHKQNTLRKYEIFPIEYTLMTSYMCYLKVNLMHFDHEYFYTRRDKHIDDILYSKYICNIRA